MKKYIAGLLTGIILSIGAGAYASSAINADIISSVKYYFDGVQKTSEQPAIVYNGSTYVPLRFMGDSLNKDVSYDPQTLSIHVNSKKTTVIPDIPQASNSVTGEWKGSYTCNQGETGLTLKISAVSNDLNNLEATFTFYPLAKNLNAKSGSYKMTGKFNKETNVIELKGTEWIEKPSNYHMVNLIAAVDLKTGKMRGNICGDFSLTKTN